MMFKIMISKYVKMVFLVAGFSTYLTKIEATVVNEMMRWDHLFKRSAIESFAPFFNAPNIEAASSAKKIKYTKSATRATEILQPQPFDYHPSFKIEQKKLFLSTLPLNKTLIFFDTETTGLSQHDRIIEMAFVRRNYSTMQETRKYNLFNPQGKKSSPKAFDCHKIPDRDLVEEKTFAQLAKDILDFIGDDLLVAHNANFDSKMLNLELTTAGYPQLPKEKFQCTLAMARKISPGEKNRLDDVCTRYGVDLSSRAQCHGAMQDTLLMADVYPILLANSGS